jgi:pimeloyl-ACP methyl ester carboxylesterase
VRDYPNARVLSISYNSTAFGDVMTSSWPDAAVQVSKHLAGEHCGLNPPLGAAPLFLVGHSLGGLMIKQLCLELEQDYPEVFARIEGVMFYATPHMGSWFGNKLECLLACLPFVRKSGVLRYLRVLSEDTADLNSAFDDVRHTLDEGLRKARFATQALTETVSGTVSLPLMQTPRVGAAHTSHIAYCGHGRTAYPTLLLYSRETADHFVEVGSCTCVCTCTGCVTAITVPALKGDT